MTLGAVLPLSIRGSYDVDDLGRTEILFKTLSAFSLPDTFGTILIVTPPHEVETVRERCQRWSQFNIEVMSEEELLPELKSHQQVRGWRKQQMVKLGAARVLSEDFFLTLDADVVCLKPIGLHNLFVDGRAILQYEDRSLHPKWWQSSARLLDMSPNVGDPDVGMSVTPTILAKDLCLSVAKELTPKRGTWVDRLCRLHNPRHPSNWTVGRLLRSKWTEYSLYYLNAMKQGLLDEYHIKTGTEKIPQLLLIHDSHPFESWDAERSFSAEDPGLFCVVGSKSGLEPEVVWDRIKHLVPDSREGKSAIA